MYAYVRPGVMRQCHRCNNFWPDTLPFYEPGAIYCAVCARRSVISTRNPDAPILPRMGAVGKEDKDAA